MTRKRLFVAMLLTCAVAAACTLGVIEARDHDKLSAGPLQIPNRNAYVVDPARYTPRFTDGFQVLRLPGDQPGTILLVESLQQGSSLKFLGAMIAGTQRSIGADQIIKAYPPPATNLGPLQEANGFTMQTDPRSHRWGYELLMGYQIMHPAFSVRTGIRITYAVGDSIYQATLPSSIVVCPALRSSESCFKQSGF